MFNLQRLLVERIESRILVGTVAFLLIMVLVGWIAINEGGRMKAFEEQYTARSIERGAVLFMNNCSTCHGEDGRGLAGIAPGLNSPYLFGHDFFAEINAEVDTLTAERDAEGTTDARKAEIDARLAELETERTNLTTSLQTAVAAGYDPAKGTRLDSVGWSSTLYNYVYTTLIHGRPNSGSYWPRAMPAWSQTAGAALRNDQLGDLTTFIMNWDKGDAWTVEDANAVRQYPRYPVDAALAAPGADTIGVSTDIATIMTELANFTGDSNNGQSLYNGALGCAGCHTAGVVAPATAGTWTRAETERLTDPALAGYTAEQYLAESITHPNDYVAPGFQPGIMPQNFADRITYQDLADLIAFLATQQ